MKYYYFIIGLILILFANGCGKTNNFQEVSFLNEDSILVNGYLDIPSQDTNAGILLFHPSTSSYHESKTLSKNYVWDENAGLKFLEKGYLVLSVEYAEFKVDNTYYTNGVESVKDAKAAYDYLKNELGVSSVFAFGFSRGASIALMLNAERNLDGVIAASGVVDWIAQIEAIEYGELIPPNENALTRLNLEMVAWGDKVENKKLWMERSPRYRLSDFKSPFMIIAGENDQNVPIESVKAMEKDYENCNTCEPGSQFIYYKGGHGDWRNENVWVEIFNFLDKQKYKE